MYKKRGFSQNLPVGEGLVSFQTLEEAVEGARSIAINFEQHCAAARAIAKRHFNAGKVLGRMLEQIGGVP